MNGNKRGRKSIAEEKRAQILEAFYNCAIRDGLEKASLRVVAEEVGTPVSVLSHYFKNRDTMISELVKKRTGEILQTLQAEIQQVKDPEKRFENIIDFFFSPKTQRLEGKSLFYDSCSTAHRSDQVRQTFKDQIREQRKKFMEILAETTKFSHLSETVKIDITNLVIALVEGTFYLLDMDGENVSLEGMSELLKRFMYLFAAEESNREING
jgi:AcrR family transcriptional regulator